MSRPIKTKTTSFIRRNTHEMAKPIKLIGKELENIIEKLVAMCDSQDEKTKLDAMKSLLKYYADAVEMRDKDEMARLLAENKKDGGLLGGSAVDEAITPLIDFDEIQNV